MNPDPPQPRLRVLLDACVIYPSVMREVLVAVAEAGLFVPLWSRRIIDEWCHAAARLGTGAAKLAGVEAALMQAHFPDAMITPAGRRDLWLPDPDDLHVLDAAIAGDADMILTLNARDFPNRVLGLHDLYRRDPDGFLRELAEEHPNTMLAVLLKVQAHTAQISARPQPMRALYKRAGMPRLAKWAAIRAD